MQFQGCSEWLLLVHYYAVATAIWVAVFVYFYVVAKIFRSVVSVLLSSC